MTAELVLLPNRVFVHLGVVSGLLLPVVIEYPSSIYCNFPPGAPRGALASRPGA